MFYKYFKMKLHYFIISLIAINSSRLFGQVEIPVNQETKKLDFTEIINVDSTTQKELYARARAWFALNFVSSKAVLEMDDKENGQLIGKVITEMAPKPLIKPALLS